MKKKKNISKDVSEETAKKKKKLITVKDRSNSQGASYTSPGMRFAFVAKPKHEHTDGTRQQVTGFASCRDGVCNTVRGHVHGAMKTSTYMFGTDLPIDMENIRLLMVKNIGEKEKVDAGIRDKIFSGKAVLNLYEDLAGWKRSKITTVNHSLYGKQTWLLTGSGNWMRAANLVSMLMLIMRVASNHGPLKTDNIEELDGNWKYLCNTRPTGPDIPYIKECWKKFSLIVEHSK